MKTCPFCAEQVQDAAVVCRHCGKTLGRPTAPPSRSYATTAIVAALIGLAVITGFYMHSQAQTAQQDKTVAAKAAASAAAARRAADSVQAVTPRLLDLVDKTEELGAGKYQIARFTVGDGPQTCQLIGRVSGTNAAQTFTTFVFTDDQLIAWQGNAFANAAVWTSGKVVETGLDVALPSAGKYSLVVSNRGGFLFGSLVHMQAKLRCVGRWPR